MCSGVCSGDDLLCKGTQVVLVASGAIISTRNAVTMELKKLTDEGKWDLSIRKSRNKLKKKNITE